MTDKPDTAREIAPLVMFGFGADRFIGASPYQNGRMTDFRPAILPADAPDPTPVQVEVAQAADEDPKVSSAIEPVPASLLASIDSKQEAVVHPSQSGQQVPPVPAEKEKKLEAPFLKMNGES